MKIRTFKTGDARPLANLFYSTIHHVNKPDYNLEQLNAWAPPLETWDMKKWESSFSNKTVFIVDDNGKYAGFGELEENGHIDRFYINKDYVGLGVGTLIYEQIEAKAYSLKLSRLFVEASLTAKPFFEKMGFNLINEQTVLRNGIELKNFVMEKKLGTS